MTIQQSFIYKQSTFKNCRHGWMIQQALMAAVADNAIVGAAVDLLQEYYRGCVPDSC
jgi:hypothetical protein